MKDQVSSSPELALSSKRVYTRVHARDSKAEFDWGRDPDDSNEVSTPLCSLPRHETRVELPQEASVYIFEIRNRVRIDKAKGRNIKGSCIE